MSFLRLFSLAIVALLFSNLCFANESKGNRDGSGWSNVCELLYDIKKPVDQNNLARALNPQTANENCVYVDSGDQHPMSETRFSASPFFLASIRHDALAAQQILKMGVNVNHVNSYYHHANYAVSQITDEPNAYVAFEIFADDFASNSPIVTDLFQEILRMTPTLDALETFSSERAWRTDSQANVLGLLLSADNVTPARVEVAKFLEPFVANKTQVLRQTISRTVKCYDFDNIPKPHLVEARCRF